MSSASNSGGLGKVLLGSAGAALLALAAAPAMAASVTWCAEAYTVNLPGAPAVPMWGYRDVTTAGAAACDTPPASPRSAAAAPVITVPAGDTSLQITLVNRLGVPTSIVIAGQDLPADGGAAVMASDVVDVPASTVCVPTPGAAASAPEHPQNCRVRSFTGETAPGATRTYTFGSAARPLRAGTFLVQSGTHPQVQVQMGLAGLVRKDALPSVSSLSGKFLFSNPDWVYDTDVPVLLSEVDDAMHARIAATLGSADPGSWKAGNNTTFDYNPRFFLVNGVPFDGTSATDLPAPTFAGGYVVLRIANAGLKSRSLVLNNGHWKVLTEDGYPYPAPREQYSLLLPAGKTSDAQVSPVSLPQTLVLFDRRGGTDNADGSPLGGQVARLTMTSGGPAPTDIADLAISKTDGLSTVYVGDTVAYTIVVTNNGPNPVSNAPVSDPLPSNLGSASWTCAPAPSCTVASGSGAIAGGVNLAANASATFTLTGTVTGTAGTLVNTASVAAPSGMRDRVLLNNSATDSDTVLVRTADLAISKSHSPAVVVAGTAVQYAITVSNATGNTAVTTTVTDTLPAALTGASWTCLASAGSTCPAGGSGNIAAPVTLAIGGSATFTVSATVSGTASGTVSNTASLSVPANVTDPNSGNNSATDTMNVIGFPSIAVLDNFTRNNANTLNNGSNWSQVTLLNAAAIRVNSNQAFCANTGLIQPCALGGAAYWNNPTAGYGAKQAAALTIAATPLAGDSLVLKATGGSANTPASFVRVRITGTQVVVETTTNSGIGYTQHGTVNLALTTNDRLTALVDAGGGVYLWKNGVYAGNVQLPNVAAWTTGGGRIGMQLPNGARVDDFAGGTVTP